MEVIWSPCGEHYKVLSPKMTTARNIGPAVTLPGIQGRRMTH